MIIALYSDLLVRTMSIKSGRRFLMHCLSFNHECDYPKLVTGYINIFEKIKAYLVIFQVSKFVFPYYQVSFHNV